MTSTMNAPEPERAQVIHLPIYRPVIVWLSDDATLRSLFGRGTNYFEKGRGRFCPAIYSDGGRKYVHVAQAEEWFGRDDD